MNAQLSECITMRDANSMSNTNISAVYSNIPSSTDTKAMAQQQQQQQQQTLTQFTTSLSESPRQRRRLSDSTIQARRKNFLPAVQEMCCVMYFLQRILSTHLYMCACHPSPKKKLENSCRYVQVFFTRVLL